MEKGRTVAGIETGRVALAVRDVHASTRFYVDGLGFHVEQLFEDPPYATLSLGALRLSLTQSGSTVPDVQGVRLEVGAEEQSSAAMVVLEVADARAAFRVLADRGVPIRSDPWEPPWGGCRFFLSDPDGYLVEVEQVA
jgi:catechol 2,3-dioxygenase-like lactoylglutathione lyase family enzyme